MKNIKIVNLRVLAILLVVLGHSIIIYSPSWGYYQIHNAVHFLELLKNIINVIQMPLFFSISGYLFYKTIKKNINAKRFIINKGKRLLIPFILVGIFWMIPIKIIINYPNYANKSIFQILTLFFLGKDTGHLWYLPSLFIIFIIMYFVNKKVSFLTTNKIQECILFLIAVVLSMISSKYYYCTYLNNSITYLVYFYLGLLINKYEEILMKLNKILLSILLIISIILSIILNNYIFNYLAAVIIVVSLYVISPNKANNLLYKIDKDSFGIYLFHSPLIYITFTYFADHSPIFVVLLNFIIFGSLSIFITEIIRKTKIKLIIGE